MTEPAWMNPNKIGFITIHCTATPRGHDVRAVTIGQWDSKKFGQVSYHYVIELSGRVVQTLRQDQRGAHVGGYNTGNLGIAYVGGVENDKAMTPADTRTDAQKASMAKLVRELEAEHGRLTIRGHRDWPHVAKACPSFDVPEWLEAEGIR